MKEIKTINGKNYFNKESLKEMIKELKKGNEIIIYISCLGHTRAIMEEYNYRRALENYFKDELELGNYSIFNTYYLKSKVKKEGK